MKVATKPIWSPSRTEKFPPPLMRFLSSSGGSKSRGRSRSSPLFFRKKNAVNETQEPSSPKVTCIGQVRVCRSSRPNSGKSRASPVKCPSFWFPKNLFCNSRKTNLRSFRHLCRKWVSFFRIRCCRKDDVKDDSPESRSHCENEATDNENEESPTEVLASSTPPRNAFLLTRCRSAPYKCPSFPTQVLVSSPAKSETEEHSKLKEEKIQKPARTSKIAVADSGAEQENEESEKQIECMIINGRNSSQSLKEESAALLEPLILTRCKSEPAKTGERLLINL